MANHCDVAHDVAVLPFLTDYRCPGGEFGYRQNLIYQTQKPRLMADDCHRIVGDVAVGLRLAEYVLRRRMYDGQRRAEFVRAERENTLEEDDTRVRIYDAGTADLQEDALSRMVFADPSDATGKEEHIALTVSDTEITSGIKDFSVGVNETYTYDVPEWATGFLWAGKKCAGYYGEHDGVRVVVVGFDIRESDFPLQAEFPVYMANALSFLNDSSLLAQNVYVAGEKIVYHPQSDVDVSTLSAATDTAGLFLMT